MWHLEDWLWTLVVLHLGSRVWSVSPLNFELTAKQSGMQGIRSVYAIGITVGRLGPLSVLVDTGSPAVVMQGDVDDVNRMPAVSFLGSDGGDKATIHYGGSTVTGAVTRDRMCLRNAENGIPAPSSSNGQVSEISSRDRDVVNQSAIKRACLMDFPVFQVQQGDSAFSQLGLDGVLGLGPSSGANALGLRGLDETVADGLAASFSALPRIFALYIAPDASQGSSMLSFGGYDESKIQPGATLQYLSLAQPRRGRWEVPLQEIRLVNSAGDGSESIGICQDRDDCRVLLDSGTSQVASVSALVEKVSMRARSPSGECLDLEAMPDIHLEFGGDVAFKLGPEDYILDKGMCSMAIEEMSSTEQSQDKSLVLILGEPFLRKVYTVFDQELGRVGLAPSAASRGPTVNEERLAEKKEEDKIEHQASVARYFATD